MGSRGDGPRCGPERLTASVPAGWLPVVDPDPSEIAEAPAPALEHGVRRRAALVLNRRADGDDHRVVRAERCAPNGLQQIAAVTGPEDGIRTRGKRRHVPGEPVRAVFVEEAVKATIGAGLRTDEGGRPAPVFLDVPGARIDSPERSGVERDPPYRQHADQARGDQP